MAQEILQTLDPLAHLRAGSELHSEALRSEGFRNGSRRLEPATA